MDEELKDIVSALMADAQRALKAQQKLEDRVKKLDKKLFDLDGVLSKTIVFFEERVKELEADVKQLLSFK